MRTLPLLILLGSTALAQSTPILPASPGDHAWSSAVDGAATPPTTRLGVDRRGAPRIEKPSVDSRAAADRVRGNVHGIDHSVMYYATQGGSLWARGANYKVSFDTAGATYIPAFGKRQPHNVPHALSPDLVTLGGELLAFEHAAPVVRDGDHVDLDRGAFVESYDLTPQALEQSFVFSSLPRTGDLVLRIPVASELEASESGAGLEFRGAFGRVVYGRATAVDARGRRQAVRTTLEDGAIELELDASFVDTAALPLVIDPIVSTFVINGWSNSNDYYSDAAYDPTLHQWVVVYEENNSGADSDVFVSALDDSGATAGGFYLDLSSDSWESVHCADNAQAQEWLIVATVISGPSQTIQGFEFGPGAPGGHQFLVANYLFNPPLFPVVGGDPAIGSGPTRFCVAYARSLSTTDWDIEAVMVDPNGVVSSEIGLSTSFNTVDTGPAISKSNDHDEWMIAWQRNSTASGGLAGIWGGRIRWDGVVTGPPFQISGTTTDARAPSVSSPLHGQLRFAVAWQERVGGVDYDILVSLLQGSTILDTKDIYNLEPDGQDQFDPSIDSDGQHFLLSHSDGFGLDYDLYASELYVLGNTLGITQTDMALDVDFNTTDDNSHVVSAASSGSTDPSLKHRYLVTWNSGPVGAWADILGGFVDGVDGGSKTPFCTAHDYGCPCSSGTIGHGCPNSANNQGALLTASGGASPTNDSLALQCTGMPPSATCIFLQGTSSVTPIAWFGDGVRCVGGTLIRLQSVTASAGAASLPVPGGSSISVLGHVPSTGGTRYYQVWYRDPANFCTPDTFNISNGMVVVWAP